MIEFKKFIIEEHTFLCPKCPDREYDSMVSFRMHRSTKHRGIDVSPLISNERVNKEPTDTKVPLKFTDKRKGMKSIQESGSITHYGWITSKGDFYSE